MFTLASKYTFEPNPDTCWLSAFLSNAAGGCVATWALKAHSKPSSIRLPRQSDGKEPISESVAFGIDCNGLSFDVLDWRELAGRSFEVDTTVVEAGFILFQWEPIAALSLTFGCTCGKTLELQAKGRGYVESAEEYFGTGEVEFSIHAWLTFTGVHTEVPINASAPIALAEAQIRRAFPKYDSANPRLIETRDGERLLGIGVHFPPRESKSGNQ